MTKEFICNNCRERTCKLIVERDTDIICPTKCLWTSMYPDWKELPTNNKLLREDSRCIFSQPVRHLTKQGAEKYVALYTGDETLKLQDKDYEISHYVCLKEEIPCEGKAEDRKRCPLWSR